MNEQEKNLLKNQIDQASVISFDIFDTLLFRKTNTPETVFDLIGKHFGIHGFRKLRMDEQNEASRRVYAKYQYPHADMDDIYEVLSEHTEIPVDWNEVKAYEIELERDALTANKEMLEIFQYAKVQGKRVVATSDMYLSAKLLGEFLEENDFTGFDYVYCSADEHKAKFNRDLFELVQQKENVPYEDILHIGDKARDDGEYPASFGIKTFVYQNGADLEKIKNAAASDIDKGLYKILYDDNKSFWYNLGVEVGGPIYLGLYQFLQDKLQNDEQYQNKKIFFLSRDGYNLYHIFKEQGFDNVEYLYTSRRALMLACITEMNEKEIATLPPFTSGQTVGELLDYLNIDRSEIKHLHDVGFTSFDDVLWTEEQKESFRQLYVLDKEVFLTQCAKERENAITYFHSIGFFNKDAICFDCGWQGSSQELIERFKKVCGYGHLRHDFIYFGIRNSQKSRAQLRGMHYDTYAFNFYKNYALQYDVAQNAVMYELFFSAPHESVHYYTTDGTVVLEDGVGDSEKEELLSGIMDFLQLGLKFSSKHPVEYSPEVALGHLKRLIHYPTEKEAITIGNMQNVDGFARKAGESKYIAFVTEEQLANNPEQEIYWPQGLLKRPDMKETVKQDCALRYGLPYPFIPPEYHLEDEASIRNYYRWMHTRDAVKDQISESIEWNYKPYFSVVIPVYNTVTEQLEECIESVLNQTYDRFELILVDDHSSWENVVPVLQKYENNEHVHVIYRHVNGHISVATNDGIACAQGDFIVFMDCDDTIEPHALYEFAKKLNENPELDFIYSDEDKITEDGKIQHKPFFKPEWSPDLFMNMMYTNHLATYRTSIVKAVGGLRTAYNGSQDYDFTLRFMEQSNNKRVGHVPKILYHWRERKESVAYAMTSKNYAAEASCYAKEDFIRRNGIKAHMELIPGMSQYRTVYEVVDNPLVSIIIPSKDHPLILQQCIDSIVQFTDYHNYELIVVDNGSTMDNKAAIETYLNVINHTVPATYIYEPAEFNFSKMCNTGASYAKGEYVLFLNDDIEVFQNDWLHRMLGHAQQPHTGAVGAKLFYPQSTILQHTGVSNPVDGPLHTFMRYDDSVPYYFGWNWVDNNCIAVTGACLLVSKQKFDEINRFDESLPVAYNDVKLCFALHQKGYYNVVRNDVAAYHHESLSRGIDQMDTQKLIRLQKERTQLFTEFNELKDQDPYLNENLRAYTLSLNLKDNFDALSEINLDGCEMIESAYIDKLVCEDIITVLGWSMIEGEKDIENITRYIVFQDPYGNTYAADTLPYRRDDVVAALNEPAYLYAGFECIVKKTDLRADIMPYRVGVLSVTSEGRKYLRWVSETNVVRNPKPCPVAADSTRLDDISLHENTVDVKWYLDECVHENSYYKVRGFAYKEGITHHQYKKSLVLLSDDGVLYEVSVQLDERVDVAYTFIEEQFLFYTGFICYIYDGTLPKNHKYEVYIRLTNNFDPQDISDIKTGGIIDI